MVEPNTDPKRFPLIAAALAAALIVISILGLVFQGHALTELRTKQSVLSAKLTDLNRTVSQKRAARTKEKNASIQQATGLDPSVVASDQALAETYFKPAFSWTNGKSYDTVRATYIKSLGANNSFTKTYLPPDTKIATNKGKLSFIDFKQLRVTMDGLYAVPIKAINDRVRYIAFVQYIIHKDASDLANKKVLQKSSAIVEFTVSGTSNRTISEVSARAGFSSGLDSVDN